MKNDTQNIIEFSLAFNRYKVKLYNYVLRLLNDRMTAQDIVQNVFLKYFENIENIRNKDSANFWLFKAARNEVFSHIRAKKVRVDQFNVSDIEDVEIKSEYKLDELVETKELERLLKDNLAVMNPEQSEVFLLKEYSGLSYKEIAEILNIDENLVKSRLYNTRQKLIDIFSKILK